MFKIKITLPGAISGIGPAISGLALAVGLYTTVEITLQDGDDLIVETEGEGAGRYAMGLRHPVALAMMRVFQRQEQAVTGLHIRVQNHIPPDSGLGSEAAFWVAGVVGAANLLDLRQPRMALLEMAARMSKLPDSVAASMLGGLGATLLEDDTFIQRTLPTAPQQLIMVLPTLTTYPTNPQPERVLLADAHANLNRIPLLTEAFRSGDLNLLEQVLADRLHAPHFTAHLPGYDHVVEMARRAGAKAVTLAGTGPALIAFAERDHRKIATVMELAFENSGVPSRSWVLPLDTQGVVVSIAGTP